MKKKFNNDILKRKRPQRHIKGYLKKYADQRFCIKGMYYLLNKLIFKNKY